MKKGKYRLLRLIRCAAFCALLAACVLGVSRLVERKASVVKVRPFLSRAGEYDVLFVGDSHMVNAVYPMELWQDYGIAGYNVAGVGNTLPVSYWVMMNALDYAQPKLVVIGVKDVEMSYKLSASSSDVHTAFDGYPLTRTKIRAIEDLMADSYAMDDAGDYYADLRWEYYFTLGKYHSRWSELTEGDFRPAYNRQKGAEMAVGVAVPNDYDIIDENQMLEESGEGYAYLRRMIEECQRREIGVMLVHLPYPSTEREQMAANAVYYIAEEYGVDFVDFVNLDQVVDYKTDCYDSFSHLNPSGARKVTDFLGRYLRDHFDLPDRREDESHSAWAADFEDYEDYKLSHIRAQGSLHSALMLLHDDDVSAAVYIPEGSGVYGDEQAMTLLQNIAREHVYEEDMFSKYSNALFPLEQLDGAAGARSAYFLRVSRADGEIQEFTGQAAREQAELLRRAYPHAHDGGEADACITVFDRRTGEVAAQMGYEL